MKAIIWTKYGSPDGLHLKEVDKPVPKDNEVLIRIYATTVTAGDCEIRSLKVHTSMWLVMRIWMGIINPRNKILGTELAGKIEAIGQNVKLFKESDQVYGSSGVSFGTNAEYICLPEKGELAVKPVNMTYEEAATVPFGGRDALYFLRKGNIQSGQKLLILGAGGTIGTYAVQLAKYFGAEVTAVDNNAKLDMLLSIGADHVIDYTQEDFTKNGETYDIIFDVVGKISFLRSKKSLKETGFYLLANPGLSQMVQGRWISMTSSNKVIFGATSSEGTGHLFLLKKLIEEGKIKTVIDRSYPLERIAEAHRYVETGQKAGNVVITVA
jgi:NADPH:quinone reductase-like Zn-dependent oxidoreductase